MAKDIDKGTWTRGGPVKAAEPEVNCTPGLGIVEMVLSGGPQGRYVSPESGSICGSGVGAGAIGMVPKLVSNGVEV